MLRVGKVIVKVGLRQPLHAGPSLFSSMGLGAKLVRTRHGQTSKVSLVSFVLQRTSPSHTPHMPTNKTPTPTVTKVNSQR